MEKIYVVVPSEVEVEEDEDEAVAFCSRADAEEYALSIAEEQVHEMFLSCINWDDLTGSRTFEGFVEEMRDYALHFHCFNYTTVSGLLLSCADPYIKEIVKL